MIFDFQFQTYLLIDNYKIYLKNNKKDIIIYQI